MFNKFYRSLCFRIPILYRVLLTFRTPKFSIKNKNSQLNLVILSGKSQTDMLNQTLISIFKNFSTLPTIYLFLDKNCKSEEIKKKIKWAFDAGINFISAEECISYHRNKGNLLVAEFADKNPMGLKLAAILQIEELNIPLLYCDTDVLWFDDPTPKLIEFTKDPKLNMALSIDFQKSYDKNLLINGNLDILTLPPYYCAGILYIKTLTKNAKHNLNNLFQIVASKSNHFSEQTLFAYINRTEGDYHLDEDLFSIILDDVYSFIPKNRPNLIARHYVGAVRHLFWRDAFFKL